MATALLNVASIYENGPIDTGDRWKNIVAFDFDHYATGGCALSLNALGFATTTDPEFNVTIQSKLGYVFQYDHTNLKVLVYWGAAFTPAGTNSQPSFTVKTGTIGTNMTIGLTADAATASLVGGTGITADRSLTTNNPVGVPTFTGSAVAAGALAEVTNNADLTALTAVRAVAEGRFRL